MRLRTLAAASLAFVACTALAVGGPRGNAVAGKQKFEATPPGGQSCASCHLDSGAKAIDNATPLLAGQYADYLEKSLKDYRSGARINVLMNAQIGPDGSNPLTDADIANIAAYLASQPESVHVYSTRLPAKR